MTETAAKIEQRLRAAHPELHVVINGEECPLDYDQYEAHIVAWVTAEQRAQELAAAAQREAQEREQVVALSQALHDGKATGADVQRALAWVLKRATGTD